MSVPDFYRQYLRDRFRQLKEPAACQDLKAALEPQVREWRWATAQMVSPEPHFKLRCPGGRWLKEKGPWAHGFDGEGRLVMTQDQTGYIRLHHPLNQDLWEEVVYADHQGVATSLWHRGYDSVGRLQWMLLVHDRGEQEEVYGWSGERLSSIERWQRAYSTEHSSRVTVDYAAAGEVELISTRLVEGGMPTGEPRVEYRRKLKGQTLAGLARAVESELLARIPKSLLGVRTASPAYAIFLLYCSSGWDLVPNLMVATEADRSRVSPDLVWYACEVEGLRVALDTPELRDLWQRF